MCGCVCAVGDEAGLNEWLAFEFVPLDGVLVTFVDVGVGYGGKGEDGDDVWRDG